MATAKRTPAKRTSKAAPAPAPAGGGYRRRRESLKITFEGELAGLRVETGLGSPEVMRRIVAAARAVENTDPLDQADIILDLCEAFGPLLVAWNYQDEDGQPLPATAAVLAAEDVSFVMALVYGWMDAVGVRAQQLTTPAEEPVVEAELPMEVMD